MHLRCGIPRALLKAPKAYTDPRSDEEERR